MKLLPRVSRQSYAEQERDTVREQRVAAKRKRLTLEQLEERQLLAIVPGPNINISQRTLDQVEGTIAIDRTDPTHLFAAATHETSLGFLGAFSTDSGGTWNPDILGDGQPASDTLPQAEGSVSAAFDDFGNLFVVYVSRGLNSAVVLNSVDGGQSFNVLTQLDFFVTQPTIATGPGFGSPGSVWVMYNQFGNLQVAGARVNGLGLVGAFSNPTTPPGGDTLPFIGDTSGDIAVGPNGQVMVTYETEQFCFGDQPGDCEGPGTIFSNVDPDGLGPQPFGRPVQVTTTNVGNFDYIAPQPNRSVGAEPGIVYDRTGGLHDGRVYFVYTDELVDESDDTDIFVRFSDNDGATWSSPLQVNDDNSGNSQFLPRIALDPTTGDVAVTWYDSRNDDGLGGSGDTDGFSNTDTQLWGTASSDGAATFEPNVQISTGTSNATNSTSGLDYGDYAGLDFFGGSFYPIWADNSTTLPNNGSPVFDVATSQVFFQDTTGPFVVSVDPVTGSLVDGPVSFMDFTFNEAMDTNSFTLADVSVFNVTDTFGVTSDLLSSLTGFVWTSPDVLRVQFAAQGPAGTYTMTIGPGITDDAGNPMDQDQDGTNGEAVQDQFTTDFTITNLEVANVQVGVNGVVVNFTKAVEPGTVTGGVSTCSASDNFFIESSGGDFAFAGDPGNVAPDGCVATIATLTAPDQVTITFLGGPVTTDLYRLNVRSGGVTDVVPMSNDLDGEFDGAPPAGNNNTFPSGDGVVGGDFAYRFITGDAPTQDPSAATLPAAQVIGSPVVLPSRENASGVSIAQDPTDSTHLVAVWTSNDTAPDPDFIRVQAAYSINSGQTWNSLTVESFGGCPGGPLLCDPTTTNPTVAYPESTDGSVAFDGNGNFYILSSQHNGGFTSGALVLQKFGFSGGTPSRSISNQIIYQWTADAAFNPTIAVDATLDSFTDPESGVTQTNTWTGNVYVAWNTQNGQQANLNNPNPNVIMLAVSHDGGFNFGPANPVNDGSACFYNPVAAPVPPTTVQSTNCGINNTDGEFDTMPRLAVSQGTADGRVPGGQLNIVWDDFGSQRRSSPPFDLIVADSVPDGGLGFNFSGAGGFLNDALDPGNNAPHIPGVSRFQINVNIADQRFVSLSDIDVRVDMTHNNLSEVSLVLIPPPQSGLAPVTLAPNRTNSTGGQNNSIGMTGTMLGVLNGFDVGTIFSQDAPRSIFVGAAPYVGYFRPQNGDLDTLDGMNLADVNGTWTLEVTDFRSSNITAPPFPFLDDWSISFQSGMTTGPDTVIATSILRGSANGPYSRTIPASPTRGIAAAPVITSDNTVGSFSPYQGRIYVAYTDAGNTGNNSDIFVVASDDGGATWNALGGFGGVFVNDDSSLDGTTGGRSQFNPAITVDQTTGTVVAAWLDARDDAANARTATYMSTSIDGGQTWSKNVFLNRKQTALSNYDQSTLVYGPVPDNQSNGNSARDQRFNFGDHIGLVASAGHVTAAWPGNENVTPLGSPVDCCTTEAVVARANISAGPRVATSTMGWVDTPASFFDVVFDRLINPTTFTADAVAPHNMLLNQDFETGLGGFVIDNSGATPSPSDNGLWHLTTGRGQTIGHTPISSVYFGTGEGANGRGSYTNGVSGKLTSPLIDLTTASPNVVLRFNHLLSAQNFFDHAIVNVISGAVTTRIADNDSSRLDNLPDQTIGFESVTLDLSAFVGQSIRIQFSFDSDASFVAEGWYIDDVRVEDLGIPGDVRVWGRDVHGNDFPVDVTAVVPTACNPIGCNQFRVLFDPQTEVGTYRYAIGPDISDRIREGGVPIALPGSTTTVSAGLPPGGPLNLRIPTSGTGGSFFTTDCALVPSPDCTVSTINVAGIPAGQVITDVNVNLTLLHTFDFDLQITLVHPDGTRVPLSLNNDGGGDNYINTTFDDEATISITDFLNAVPPFTGSFQPESPLSQLDGRSPNGTYRLEIIDDFQIDTGTLLNWSITIQTGQIITGAGKLGNAMDQNGDATTGQASPVDSPPLFNSATTGQSDVYLTPLSFDDSNTLPLQVTGPRVAPDLGAQRVGAEYPAIDPSLKLGLGFIDGGVITRSPNLPLADGTTTSDTINVPGSFTVSDLNVRLTITHPRVDDLDIVLRNVTTNKSIRLVADVPNNGSNFTNTTFDDESVAAIQSTSSAAPYTGSFRPRDPLSLLDGINAQGNWRLEITDDTANGISGVLNSWTLDFGLESKFTIDDHFPITDLDAFVSLVGSNLSDVRVELTHDDNLSTIEYDPTTVVLFDAGDASGTVMDRTVFSDEAAAGVAPGGGNYRGSFRPDGFLGLFDDLPGTPFGQSDAHGVWKLRVTDVTGNGSTGTLNNWGVIVNPTLRVKDSPGTVLTDNGTIVATINVAESFIVSDVNVQVSITHPRADELHLSLVNALSGITVPLVNDVAAGGSDFSNTIFADEATRGINDPTNVAPYVGYFRPESPLSAFNGIDGQGSWNLVITDDSADFITGALNNWSIDFGQSVQTFDQLALHGAANFMDFRFDRDMDPSTFTTVDINRIIGPDGQLGANPLGPFRYAPLDTTPNPIPIPDSNQVTSTITVADDFKVGDVDVLLQINHPNVDQLHIFLVGPNGQRLELVDNLTASPTPNLITTIFDDEAPVSITTGTAPYVGRFRPTQPIGLKVFDGLSSKGQWKLEVNDEAIGGVGTLVRWELVLTRAPNRYSSTPATPIAIPDNGAVLNNTITVPESYPIHDLEVTLNITHPQIQDLEVTLVGPGGTRVALVANMPATGGQLTNTVFDDEATNIITTGETSGGRCAGLPLSALVNPSPSCTVTFRPVLQRLASDTVSQLSDFDGLNAQGTWTLEIRDKTSGNSTGVQQLNSWSLAITPSDFRILPNPDGTDPNPNFPRTYRIYFPRQILSGTYAVSIGPNILSQEQSADLPCFTTGVSKDRSSCGLDSNRNAGLEALRRGDGVANDNVVGVDLRPGGLAVGVDFQSVYDSRDVGDAVNGRPIPEPVGTAVRPITSRIFIPDNVIISDLNIRLTITNQQPPGSRPLMRDDDYDVFLISPSGTRLELFSDVGGAGVDFVDLFLNDEADRCQKSCNPIYVQDGSAPFSDDFRPEPLKPTSAAFPEGSNGLKIFDGEQARGVWTLEISDDTANGLTAALRNWSIEVSGRTTGLAEYAADQISSSFRLFVMDPSDPRSSTAWTAVGPAAIGLNGNTSRSGAIAVDPSDPSGNTVFFAGATSGVWKTTNFLTANPEGPTWIPLTDLAPTLGLHMGSISLFPRNNDPKQTIVYVATGEGDAGFPGVGVLKSEDGGATWSLQDSLNNDPNVAFAQRDHTFSGTNTSFKIVVDPTFPDGRVAYMAMSGARGGIYKTVNGGVTWVLSRAGQATDVVLDPVNTEVLYGAFRGEGVFISSNRGAQWLLTTGGINNVQVRDADPGTPVTMPIGAPAGTPNGGKGRISLAKPKLLGDPTIDKNFEGRLYAIVATPNDLLDGVYMTSDFGANWTKLKLGKVTPPACSAPPTPTNNDLTATDVDPFDGAGCSGRGQGNYDQAVIVDPQDPNRIYVFGTGYPSNPVIAIDVALTYDGHNYTIFDYDNNDGGLTELDTVGGAIRKQTRDNGNNPPFCEPFAGTSTQFSGTFCVILGQTFTSVDDGTLSTTGVFQGNFNNIASFANNGFETRWTPILPGVHPDYHDVAAIVDPLTGQTRLIGGNDGGIFSWLVSNGYDENGDPNFADGTLKPFPASSIGNSIGPADGSRNGNLQMTQVYGGATHPSQLAAELAFLRNGGNGGLFYNATQDNGSNKSDPFILDNGNLVWSGYGLSGDSGGGLTTTLDDNDNNLHTVYIYEWPCCLPPGEEDGVIRRNNIAAVGGLDQEALDQSFGGPANDLAINARDGNELLFSSPTSGRLYKTDDGGQQWLTIGVPAVFNGLQASAMAFGAEQPDPNPTDSIEPDEVIYIGLPNGRLMASLTEGGDNGQEWFDISAGLFGGAVEDISANIRQFHYDVYLVTSTRVFFMPNAKAAIDEVRANGVGGSNVNNPWIDITGNLRSIQHTVFPGAWNGEGTLGPIVDTLPIVLSSIKVDDRYDIPDANGDRHPLVYVGAGDSPGGGGGAGVYRTFDNGGTWRRYPDIEVDGAVLEGGYLPNVGVTEIELALGPIDPETGLSDFTQSLDLLVAHTYGRASFAIRSAPLIFTSQGGLISNSPDLLDLDDSVPPVPPFPPPGPNQSYRQDNITNHDGSPALPLRFTGLTHRGATVRLLEDNSGVLTEIGRGLADFFTGDWTVAVGDTDADGTPDGLTLGCGQHVIRAQGISASGTVGQVSDPLTITVLNEPPVELFAPDLLAADDSGVSSTDNITRVTAPRFTGSTFCGGSGQAVPQAIIRLMVRDPAGTIVDPNDPNPATNHYRTVGLGNSALDGSWTVQVDPATFPPVLSDGTYVFVVRAEDLAGNIGPISPPATVKIDTQVSPAPLVTNVSLDTCAPLASLPPTACTYGSRTDLITNDQTLIISGVSEPSTVVTLRFVGGAILSTTIAADAAGNWSFDNTAQTLAPGTYSFAVSAIDIAGNVSPLSAPTTVVVDTAIAQPSAPDLVATSDSGSSNSDNITNDDTPTFTGTAEPLAQIQFFDGANPLGAPVVASSTGAWTFTSPALTCAVALGCSHNFSIVATDLAGNVSLPSPVLTVVIDTVAPTAPPSTPDLDTPSDSVNNCSPPTNGTNIDNYTRVASPTFVGTAEPNSIVTVFEGNNVRLGTTTVGPDNGSGVGNWTFTVPTNLAAGVHNIFARTTDLAGNEGPNSGILAITVDISVSAPSAPDLAAASDTGNSSTDNLTSAATLTFNGTSEAAPGNGCVEVTASPTAGGAAISLGFATVDAGGSWSLVTSVALADGTYSVTARATDRAGNVSGNSAAMSPNLTIDRTPPTPPTMPDLIASSDTGISNSDNVTRDDTPTFTGNAIAGTRVDLFRDCNTIPVSLGNPVTPAANGVWTFTSPSLADGTYVICATATDAAGNRSANSPTLTVVIDTVIAQPLAPDLDPLSDTGISNSDDITRDNTPTFTNGAGSAEANSTITVFDGINPLSTVPVTANGSWTFTAATALVDGMHSITVRAVDVAGNQSQLSVALALLIDTQIATPSITGITEDRGPSSTDRITNDQTLLFRGTAEAGSTILFSQTGSGALVQCPVPSPNSVTDNLGNWTFDNTCRTLPEGNVSFSVTATDIAGNTSGASALFGVVIDTTSPGVPAGTIPVPTLALADDTGVQGDNITRLRQPHLTGTVTGVGVGNILVEILSPTNTVLGSTRTAANGTYTVQFASVLNDGLQTVLIRATDDAGNTAVSSNLAFTVDSTPPRILSFTPTGTLTTTTSQLVVQFNDDSLNTTSSGDPAFAGSVRNLSNFRLVSSTLGVFDLSHSDFLYDPQTDLLVINLRNSAGDLVPLRNGTWQFTINGTTSLQDVAGNRIDGENPGVRPGQTTPFPTGNNVEGGDFVSSFTISVPPAKVNDIHLAGTKKAVQHVTIDFSQPLDRTLASSSNAYHLIDAGRDRQFDTSDDIPIEIGLPKCNPLPAACTTVTVSALRGQSLQRFLLLTIDRNVLKDAGGNQIDVSSARHFVGRGKALSYTDSNGDFVNLSLQGGGLMDVIRHGNGEGLSIHVERSVPQQSAIPGKSALVGTVTRQGSGDGVTHFDLITGTTGLNLSQFPRPPFIIPPGQISAQVVDRLLSDGGSASDIMLDEVVATLAKRKHHRS